MNREQREFFGLSANIIETLLTGRAVLRAIKHAQDTNTQLRITFDPEVSSFENRFWVSFSNISEGHPQIVHAIERGIAEHNSVLVWDIALEQKK